MPSSQAVGENSRQSGGVLVTGAEGGLGNWAKSFCSEPTK